MLSLVPRIARLHRRVQAPGPGLTVTFLTWLVLAQGGGGYNANTSKGRERGVPLVWLNTLKALTVQNTAYLHTQQSVSPANHILRDVLTPPPSQGGLWPLLVRGAVRT